MLFMYLLGRHGGEQKKYGEVEIEVIHGQILLPQISMARIGYHTISQ